MALFHKPYEDWYHQLINNAIHRPYKQSTRDFLARHIRIERREASRAAVRNLVWDITHISWPIKLRSNGRYT